MLSDIRATVTELEQPHRFDWVINCTDGWQGHVSHSADSKGDTAADAIDTAKFHLLRKGVPLAELDKRVTVVRLKKAVQATTVTDAKPGITIEPKPVNTGTTIIPPVRK